MSSYSPLTRHLLAQQMDVVHLSFAEIETIIGRKLPRSASTHRSFWSNNGSNNVMTRAWLSAGFSSEQVNLPGQTLVFRRLKEQAAMSGFNEAQAPFETESKDVPDKLALFGWMKGTITFAPGLDLTEPADPALADYLDQKYGSDDPAA